MCAKYSEALSPSFAGIKGSSPLLVCGFSPDPPGYRREGSDKLPDGRFTDKGGGGCLEVRRDASTRPQLKADDVDLEGPDGARRRQDDVVLAVVGQVAPGRRTQDVANACNGEGHRDSLVPTSRNCRRPCWSTRKVLPSMASSFLVMFAARRGPEGPPLTSCFCSALVS